jgi:hypothetical protein
VFGGQATITRHGDVGPAAREAEKNQVVNALLTEGDVALRASDRGEATLDLQTVELPVLGAGEPQRRDIFDGLAHGGTVRVRLGQAVLGRHFRRQQRPARYRLASRPTAVSWRHGGTPGSARAPRRRT